MKITLIIALLACVVVNHTMHEPDATLDAYISAIIIAVIVLPMGGEKNRDDEKLEE